MDQNVSLLGVNIYVLYRMPRDCTALAPGGFLLMYSPGPCRDPIFMVKVQVINPNGPNVRLRKVKRKKKKNVTTIVRRPLLQPGNYSTPGGLVTAPAAFGGKTGNRSMFPISRGMGPSMRVSNYEQMIAVTGSNGSFSAGGNVINPGLPGTFPWLSTIAANYQSFRFNFLRFVWVPSCPTTTQGSAFLYLDYNFNCSSPTTLAQVDVTAGSCTGQPWLGSPISPAVAFKPGLDTSTNINVALDVRRLTQPWYNVRTTNNANTLSGGALGGVIPGGLTFTSGQFPDISGRPATIYYGSNTNTANVIGIIYACYDIEFFDPVAAALQS